MRLLILSDRYAPEARSAAHLFRELAEELAARGHEVTVVTKMPTDFVPGGAGDPPLPFSETRNGVRIFRLRGLFGAVRSILLRGIDQVFLGARMLWRALRMSGFDAVVVSSPPLPLAISALAYCRLRAGSCVLNLHDLYPRTAVELGVLSNRALIWGATWLENVAYRNANHIVIPSEGSRRYLITEKGIPEERVSLIPNWVNLKALSKLPGRSRFRAEAGLEGKFVASYAGLVGIAQDLTSIIECARRWQAEEEAVFLIVGDGARLEEWRARSRDLKNVKFLPPVPQELYYEILRASDVCLMPLAPGLESPAIPGKLQSIMAVGKPVVAIVPLQSNAAQVVQVARCGLVVPPGDTAALEGALRELRSRPSLGEEFGRRGREYAEQHYGMAMAISNFEAVILKAAGKGRAAFGR